MDKAITHRNFDGPSFGSLYISKNFAIFSKGNKQSDDPLGLWQSVG